jgi:cyclic pyranopterin phosphate synthase
MSQQTLHRARSSHGLVDPFGRRIEYVRLSVTDRCNLRCFYCLPRGFSGFESPDDWLSFSEIERVMRAFAALGVSRIRLTGGEPLVRHELPALVSRLKAIDGIEDLSLSTNAVLLSDHAEALVRAGVTRINVSLDTLRRERFAEITNGAKLQQVIAGLQAADRYGMRPIKINMVALKGVNDDEFEDMLEFCIRHRYTLRFIETMPIGAPSQQAGDHYLALDGIRQRLAGRYELIPGLMTGGGPARYYRIKGSDTEVGFITPISQHFCASCNRVRLTVDGTLYLCLGQEHSVALRPMLRAGIDDADLQHALRKALALKPESHDFNQHSTVIGRSMSLTGG